VKQLAVYVPGLQRILDEIPEAWIQLIQGVIPTILVAAWTSSLPTVLIFLCKMQGLETESLIEMSVLSKYFFYQLWNVVFVQGGARAFIYDLILNPLKVMDMVHSSSSTLIIYVVFQAMAVYPAQLLLITPLLTWLRSDASPRHHSDAYYPTTLNYGVAYPVRILTDLI